MDEILIAFFTLFMLVLAGVSLSAINKPFCNRFPGGLLVGVAVLSVLCIEVDMFVSSARADESLAPLKKEFAEIASADPDHQYASNERGSTLDYGGRLDNVLRERRAAIKEMGLSGLLVRWHTDGGWTSFYGLFLHKWLCLGLLMIWLTLTLVVHFGKEPRPRS